MNKKLSMNKKTFLTYIFIHFEHLHTYNFFVHIYIIATYTYTSHMNKKIKLIKKHIATYEQKHIATYIHIYIIYIYDQKTIKLIKNRAGAAAHSGGS